SSDGSIRRIGNSASTAARCFKIVALVAGRSRPRRRSRNQVKTTERTPTTRPSWPFKSATVSRLSEQAASLPIIPENPPLPPIPRDGPVLLLDLQPPPRRPALVRARFVLSDVALVAALDNPRPRSQPIEREAPDRKHQLAPGHDVF